MSALATLLAKRGIETTGADRDLSTPNIAFLESTGIKCFPDDGSGVDGTVGQVVVSTAIEASNPGLLKAKALGIPVVHRAKALAAALADRKIVAVAGTCGKSTVTAMLGHVLAECGKDPLCVDGANVPGWTGAVRAGEGEFAVAEVDESDKSLTAFRPYAAIVTNASADHYSKEEMDEVFDAFVAEVPGPVIDGRRERFAPAECSMPGRHNRANAALALAMAVRLGCDEAAARAALMTFRGVERRMQRMTPPGAKPAVFDDYAHNPEKIKAFWETLAEEYPEGICVAWRPHGYAPLRKMMDALSKMFSETVRPCDKLLLLPVYDAGGTADRSVSSAMLAERLPPGTAVECDGLDSASGWMAEHSREFGAFAFCGARDPGLHPAARSLAGSFVEIV